MTVCELLSAQKLEPAGASPERHLVHNSFRVIEAVDTAGPMQFSPIFSLSICRIPIKDIRLMRNIQRFLTNAEISSKKELSAFSLTDVETQS